MAIVDYMFYCILFSLPGLFVAHVDWFKFASISKITVLAANTLWMFLAIEITHRLSDICIVTLWCHNFSLIELIMMSVHNLPAKFVVHIITPLIPH